MKCEVSQTDDVKKDGNLRIFRFYDITNETVVTSPQILVYWENAQ